MGANHNSATTLPSTASLSMSSEEEGPESWKGYSSGITWEVQQQQQQQRPAWPFPGSPESEALEGGASH